MELTWKVYLIVCPFVFLAGLVDSVAGGGGLISLPAYYLAGLPPLLAAGTNKLSAGIGTLASASRYLLGKKADWKAGLVSALGALIGSYLGTRLFNTIPERTIRWMVIGVIPVVAAITLLRGSKPPKCRVPAGAFMPAAAAIGLAIGFYDGLVGPGTGTFLILLFTGLLGMESVTASGTAKLVNLTSNIASLAVQLSAGNVLIPLGLAAAVFGVAGNWLGASLSIRKGGGFIRGMMLVVLILLLARMIVDVL